MIGTENLVAERWLISRIQSAQQAEKLANPSYVVVRVHNEMGPQVDTNKPPPDGELPYYPAIMIRNRADLSLSRGNAGTALLANFLYLIEVIGRNSSLVAIEPYVALVHAAVQQRPNIAGGVRYCIRKNSFKLMDEEKGIRYQRLGNEYEIAVDAML